MGISQDNLNYPINTEWYFEVVCNGAIPGITPEQFSYERLEVVKDTVIHDTLCLKIEKSGSLWTQGTWASNYEYIYCNDNKVYWYSDIIDSFTLLYDFDAEQGDSWIVKICERSGFSVIVDSIDFSYYGDVMYKNLYVSNDDHVYYLKGKIISTIGNIHHFFPNEAYVGCLGCCPDGCWYGDIRCFSSGDEYINFKNIACDSVYEAFDDIVDVYDKTHLNVYPNPVSDILNIQISSADQYIAIFDILGRNIMTVRPTALRQQIDVSDFPKGLYVVKTRDATAKFVKQ